MMMDEKIYNVTLYILLAFELLLSIPLAIDTMLGKTGFEIVYVVGILHVAMFMMGEICNLRNMEKRVHVMGVIAFLGSFLPLVPFIFHLIVVSFIIKGIKNRKGGVIKSGG